MACPGLLGVPPEEITGWPDSLPPPVALGSMDLAPTGLAFVAIRARGLEFEEIHSLVVLDILMGT